MELPVGVLERLLDALDVFNDLHLFDEVDIKMVGVSYQSENRLASSLAVVHLKVALFQPSRQHIKLRGGGIFFKNDDHLYSPSSLCYVFKLNKIKKAP